MPAAAPSCGAAGGASSSLSACANADRACGVARPREAYTSSQWAKAAGKGTCTACQSERDAEAARRLADEARAEQAAMLEVECVICFDEVPPCERVFFRCGHWACRGCARGLFQRGLHTCPLCRSPLNNQQAVVSDDKL